MPTWLRVNCECQAHPKQIKDTSTVGGHLPPFMRMFTCTCSYFKKEMLEELIQRCVTDHYAIIEDQSVHTALSDNYLIVRIWA